jgi:hypothetical protein
MPRIRPVKNLREYFKESVTESMQCHEVEVDEHTSHYIVDLLTGFARSEALFDRGERGYELRPLALVLADAVDAERRQKQRALQRVGDVSLFIAAFLGDGLASRVVDIDYYVRMGGSAYAALSDSTRASLRHRVMSVVFAELAAKFQDVVDVLTALRDDAAPSQEDVLRLYDVWLRTGSRRAARRLRQRGIEPQQSARRPSQKPH